MQEILKGEERRKAEVRKRFIANMKKASFVVDMVGVEQPPCFCCLRKVNKTCPHVVGELDCRNYILYSESPEKVERKLFDRINEVHRERIRSR